MTGAAAETPLRSTAQRAVPDTVAPDIAAAGRLRTQAQRLAKLYVLQGAGIRAGQTQPRIAAALADAAAVRGQLARYERKPETQRLLGRIDRLWLDMRAVLEQEPDKANSEEAGAIADELATHIGKLALSIEGEADNAVGRLLDLSSRLNMLSQRLARLYLQVYAGNGSQGLRVDIEQARREFANGLKELDTARENTPASRQAIDLARTQWIFFDNAIGELDSGRDKGGRRDERAARNVATSSERIAQVLDETGARYALDYAQSERQGR